MRLASELDFYNGPVYTNYRHHEGYAKRAQLLQHLPEPLLIVGCAFGFLVDELLKLKIDAWGIDASKWAVEKRVSERVVLADILNMPFSHFSTVVTEDLLPCLTDAEVKQVAASCADIGPLVIHMVTEQGEADLNYHSTGYWVNLTGQLTISLEGM
jgi:hypothetical protein